MIHARFSVEGWLLGAILTVVVVIAPIAYMGLRSKSFFKKIPQVLTR
jgi:hypothetical protein